MNIIDGLEQIGAILDEIVRKPNNNSDNDNDNGDKQQREKLIDKRLRFINQSVCDYNKIVANLIDYFEMNLPLEEFNQLQKRIDMIVDDECKICELITQLLKQTESDIDENGDMFEQILVFLAEIPKNIREHLMEMNHGEQYH
ncbi:hypothetical protein BLA29_010981 [Euroglyphus maynei]|uniref:Uncharacterized protein n=1 Tax=Euroglyphus maynei TaxID=6958 RepID=A0A1Y3BKI5_EURMA|nr:hypothetical protein BLA29_010981 [Euroglyphus maynei]